MIHDLKQRAEYLVDARDRDYEDDDYECAVLEQSGLLYMTGNYHAPYVSALPRNHSIIAYKAWLADNATGDVIVMPNMSEDEQTDLWFTNLDDKLLFDLRWL